MASISIRRPGALTLVQDLGRPGFGASGVPRGGAFDRWAARAANRSVGNPDGAALLEITLLGPSLELDGVAEVALVGDSFEIEIDDERSESGDAGIFAWTGARRISIGRPLSGVRAWLAFRGGIEVPPVLGSRGTDLAGGFGGFEGRALRAGDRLVLGRVAGRSRAPRRRGRSPADEAAAPLRVLPGPDRALLPHALDRLSNVEWSVSPRSDRRGVRLTGAGLELAPHVPLRSQGTLPGAVQIPPSGEPIVLGVDAPVTGGYPWVAQVIEADIDRLAHLAPGAPVRFVSVGFDEADRALAERRRSLDDEETPA